MWIMIAGPYRSGGVGPDVQAERLLAMNEAAHEVWRKGHVPVIGVNLALPVTEAAGEQHYEEIMLPLSLALAKRCDAVLRIGGPSTGADQELNVIQAQGGTVYRSVAEIPDGG